MSSCYDFVSLQSYTIGCGALRELKRITRGYGKRYLIILDHHATEGVTAVMEASLTQPVDSFACPADNPLGRATGLLDDIARPDTGNVIPEYEFYQAKERICSRRSAQVTGEKIRAYQPDVVVAVGGSKCQDLVRAALHFVGDYHRPKLVLCPTIAASNASSNGMSVMYGEDTGQMADFWSLAVMPECVIVDTEVIIRTPVSTFVAGIGDQISSSLEALHTLQTIGAYDTCDPLCIAHHRAVLDVLKNYSASAVQAMKRGEITREFEWVCHALTRYTGPQLAVATSFLSHILDEALMDLPAVAKRMHGEVVGFGVLPEMVAFGTPDEIYPWVELYRQIGLPVTLEELGLPGCDYETLLSCCRGAADKIMASRALVRWKPEEMAQAVMTADGLVRAYLNQAGALTQLTEKE